VGFIASSDVNFIGSGEAEVIVVWKDSPDVTVSKLSDLALEPIKMEDETETSNVLSIVPDPDETTH
jgi:hypothetical protein